MNRNEILRRWPNASEDLIRANLSKEPGDINKAGSALPYSEPQPHKAPALDSPIPREEKGIQSPRARISFTLFRVKLLDPDNASGSVKDLLDGLRHAGIIEGDEWYRIKLEVEQEKVAHYKDEKTVITILK